VSQIGGGKGVRTQKKERVGKNLRKRGNYGIRKSFPQVGDLTRVLACLK
jgi:hypothetical protein